MSKKDNMQTSSLLQSSTTQILQMPTEIILEEVAQHYDDNRKECRKGNLDGKVRRSMERIAAHSSILQAEGKRLAHTQPELADKLFLASLFWQDASALQLISSATLASRFRSRLTEIRRQRILEARKKRVFAS